MNTTFRTVMVACALGIAVGSSGPVLAGDTSTNGGKDYREHHLTYYQSDFADVHSTKALYNRIKAAVNSVCRSSVSPRNLREFQDCLRDLTDNAVKQANQPMLTALHEKRDISRFASR